jgi:acetyl-CoA carboxylase biotin carboxyl carrier protein
VESDSNAGSNRPFDPKTVEFLVKLMAEQDLSEIDLHEGQHRIRLRRGGRVVTAAPVAAPVAAAVPAAAPVAAPAAPAAPKASYHEIKSPMVGTFYAKPKPDADDYVKVGSRVKPDSIVCKLEAMKLFNDLLAECTGTIAEVCVKNGQSVEFGTVLFRVDLN